MLNDFYRFVSRVNPRSAQDHIILGVLGYKPREFAAQMNLNIANGWGIVRTIVDMVLKMGDGKYVIVKDPNKNVVRLYSVPSDAFEEDGGEAEKATIAADDEE
jgi:translation initiation factor 3 subunit D